MPSRAEMRVRLEHVLRGIVIAALALMFWQSLRETTDSSGRSVRARGVGGGVLARWSSASRAPAAIHLQLDSVPASVERAWLNALHGAGSTVTWSGDIPATMIDAEPVASPAGGTRVLIATPNGSSVVLSDDIGAIDTIQTQNRGASLVLNSVAGNLTARAKGSVASTVQHDSVVLHKVLVIGEAGWESKFVVAALEEEGWKVDAFIRVAPDVDITQGSAVIDTSRYLAVIALDGAASPYANRIAEFVHGGGGVILVRGAASLDAMSPLRAGPVGRASPRPSPIPASGAVSLSSLALNPITSLREDAIALEKRAGSIAVAARRFGAGRVVQTGYEETWRWRMGGGEGAVRDHRGWWTELVSRVAYAPRISLSTNRDSNSAAQLGGAQAAHDAAPLADLVATIGQSVSTAAMSSSRPVPSTMLWLFIALAAALAAEVASRRMRGAS